MLRQGLGQDSRLHVTIWAHAAKQLNHAVGLQVLRVNLINHCADSRTPRRDANQIFRPQSRFQIVGRGGSNGALDSVIAGVLFGIHDDGLFNSVAILEAFFKIEENIRWLNNADFDHAFFLAAGDRSGDK